MDCELKLKMLECGQTGVGFTGAPLNENANKLKLMTGHGNQFPNISGGQYFYITIKGCDGCCERAKVTAREADTLTLERSVPVPCQCIGSNAKVEYSTDERYIYDIAASVHITALTPLKYNCITRTISVDCKELFSKDCGGCDCGEGLVSGGGGSNSGPSLRGAPGRDGVDGVGIAKVTISQAGRLLVHLTNGQIEDAGTLPTRPGTQGAPGPKGDRGDTGLRGEAGERGPAGQKGDKGDTGPQGPAGEKGEKGDPGHIAFQIVQTNSDCFVFGEPSTDFRITSPVADAPIGQGRTGADGIAKLPKLAVAPGSLIRIETLAGKLMGIGGA